MWFERLSEERKTKILGREREEVICTPHKILLKGKRQSNPETGLRGLEGSGRLRVLDF
jgi:hypothetical protein